MDFLNKSFSQIANMSTLKNEHGEAKPYQPRYVIFESDTDSGYPEGTAGVKVAEVHVTTEDERPPIYRFNPNHPLAIKEGKWQGYVAYPNVNMHTEFVDALEATRAYEANIGVLEVTKNLGQQTLKILA